MITTSEAVNVKTVRNRLLSLVVPGVGVTDPGESSEERSEA